MDLLARSAFSVFALTQNLPLTLIAEGAAEGRLPLAERHTPEWFAAAAETDASLLDMAPELRAGVQSAHDDAVLDLVRIYGEGEPILPPDAPPPPPAPIDLDSERVRIDLLKELGGLED